MKAYNLAEVISRFGIDADFTPCGGGHINDTYISQNGYVLQRINHNVFKKPAEVMSNIALVTAHLREKIARCGGNPDRETLTVIKTADGADLYKTGEGDYFRMYLFVGDTCSYATADSPRRLNRAAKAFGRFARLLDDFPAEKLYYTIPDFHDTRVRYKNLKRAVGENIADRAAHALEEIDFALARGEYADVINNAMEQGEVPLRVTHNDTKLNNVLFDNKTDDAVCVVDLDTVMPGSLLYDFGDAIRSGVNPAAEDERDLSKVFCDEVSFEAYAQGFLEETRALMTERETQLLAASAKIMTYECGIRFLTDYLNGDVYFKIARPEHNLDRARAQFKLLADMERKTERLNEIIYRGL